MLIHIQLEKEQTGWRNTIHVCRAVVFLHKYAMQLLNRAVLLPRRCLQRLFEPVSVAGNAEVN